MALRLGNLRGEDSGRLNVIDDGVSSVGEYERRCVRDVHRSAVLDRHHQTVGGVGIFGLWTSDDNRFVPPEIKNS